MTRRFVSSGGLLAVLVLAPWLCNAAAPDVNPAFLGAMKWRQIGPFRGGRVVAVSGVPGDADTWYFGGVAGGVWKSTDVGASWKPMFDDQKNNLRYPNMLNEQYDTFSGTLDTEDFSPTESQRQVFAYLHGELAAVLAKWRTVSDTDLPALQALMRTHGVPAIGTARAP